MLLGALTGYKGTNGSTEGIWSSVLTPSTEPKMFSNFFLASLPYTRCCSFESCRKWQRVPYEQKPVSWKRLHRSVLYLGCLFTLRSSSGPWANWHLWPYLHWPVSSKDRHNSVLYLILSALSLNSFSVFSSSLREQALWKEEVISSKGGDKEIHKREHEDEGLDRERLLWSLKLLEINLSVSPFFNENSSKDPCN